MDRREFLKYACAAGAGMLVPGLQCWAAESGAGDPGDHRLIVIFLRGAVDGLSMLVPYGDPKYYSLRPNVAIAKPGQEAGVVDLDGYFGLHPSLAPVQPYWKDHSLAFVVCSGSPDPTRSHFDAQDYMETGMPGVKTAQTGWLNRLLAQMPSSNYPVRAINIGVTTPRILNGAKGVASYTPKVAGKVQPVDRPVIAGAFRKMYEGRNDDLGKAFTEGMSARVTLNNELDDEMMAADAGAPQARNFKSFGQQLGRLVAREPRIKVAFVALGGFDTHVNQGAGKGQLANQLATVGTGVAQLIEGLGAAYKNTTIIVMSEFGRTVKENGNLGTDHGHGNVMMVLGGNIAGGKVHGRWSGLESGNLFEQRDLPVSTDFRSVAAQVIAEQMRFSKAALGAVFPDFPLTDGAMRNLVS